MGGAAILMCFYCNFADHIGIPPGKTILHRQPDTTTNVATDGGINFLVM